MDHRQHAAVQIERAAAAVAAVTQGLDSSFEVLVDRLLASEGRVITSAVGNSGAIAARMAHIWALSDIPAFHLDAGQALHGAIGAVREGDTVIAISKGGNSEETTTVAQMSRERGAYVVALTSLPDAPLARIANAVQLLPSTNADYAETIGMGSSLAQAAWGDAVAVAVLTRRGVGRDELERRHPAGSVGARARGTHS